MKKRMIVLLLLAAVLCMSTLPALAEDTGFNASLQITRTETSVRVTVQDSEVLAEHTPMLQIPCAGMGWTYAKVTFGGKTLSNVSWDAASETVSFPVAEGGDYLIEAAQPPQTGGSGVVPSLPTPQKPEKPPVVFSDVDDSDWFYTGVTYVCENGIMEGMGDGTFAPHKTLTRAMLVQVLYNLAGRPQSGKAPFSDVTDGDWFADAVAWAAEAGVVNGITADTFAPNTPVTREQLAAMLCRFHGEDAGFENACKDFRDAESVSPWAVSAMNWAVGTGLIDGIDGALVPRGGATRAQTAVILLRDAG